MRVARVAALYQSFPMLVRQGAQVWSYSPQYRRPRHFHAEPELNLVIAGQARFGIGSQIVDVASGELVEFAAGQDHELLHGSSDLVLFAVGITQDLQAQIQQSEPKQAQLLTHVRPRTDEWHTIVRHCSSLTEGAAAPLVTELWQRLHAMAPLQNVRTPQVGTRKALGLIRVSPELSRDGLARFSRVDSSELSRLFHRDMGLTLVEYRTRLRLLKFIRLVDAQSSSMMSAAIEAGFGSYSQCHRAFAAQIGCSPREFFTTPLRSRMEDAFDPR